MTVKGLNGEIGMGDRVAFAVRQGNTGEIVVGEVIGFEDRKDNFSGSPVVRVKVRVEASSGWPKHGDIAGCEVHSRMVKL